MKSPSVGRSLEAQCSAFVSLEHAMRMLCTIITGDTSNLKRVCISLEVLVVRMFVVC